MVVYQCVEVSKCFTKPSPRKFADKFIRESRKKLTKIIFFRLIRASLMSLIHVEKTSVQKLFVRILRNRAKNFV